MSDTAASVVSITDVTSTMIENSTLLKRFLTRFLSRPQDVEDVAQEAFLRAYMSEKKAEIDHPKAFLFRVARNIALNELKKKLHHVTDFIEDYDAPALNQGSPTLEDVLQAQQHLGLYCEALAILPKQCRKVCLLRKVHGLKHKEIAELLNLSVSSVEKHLRKGALVCDAYISECERGVTC